MIDKKMPPQEEMDSHDTGYDSYNTEDNIKWK